MTSPTTPQSTIEALRTGWRSAFTLANNLCVQVSDRYNADDQTREANGASTCIQALQPYLQADESYIADMLVMLPPQPDLDPEPALTMADRLRASAEAWRNNQALPGHAMPSPELMEAAANEIDHLLNRSAFAAKAFTLADAAMLELLRSHCVMDELSIAALANGEETKFGLCDENSQEVTKLLFADPAIQEAAEWLISRGLARLEWDSFGECLIVLAPRG